MLTLSLRDRDKIAVLRAVDEGLLRPCEGARKLGISSRQLRRLRRVAERKGDSAVIHGLRARPSNHRIDEALKTRVLERASEPIYHDFGPTLLAEHLSRDPSIGYVASRTLRNWMITAGLWSVSERKLRHRSRRERRAAFGELVQMDTSIHKWFEGRSAQEPVLIAMIDDATSKLFARFEISDSGGANRRLIASYIKRFGRMGALYVDRATHFQAQKRSRELADEPPMSSVIKRGLQSLDIELISALSPQAKGRVERLFKTLQDRLLKEMRVSRISTIEAANQFLEQSFIPFWNERFSVKPQISQDFHRPLPEEIDLMEIFAEVYTRQVRADFTIRYENIYYQVPKHLAAAAMPGTKLKVLRRLDGKLSFQWGPRNIELTRLPGLPDTPLKIPRPRFHPEARPMANHPWRKSNLLFSLKD